MLFTVFPNIKPLLLIFQNQQYSIIAAERQADTEMGGYGNNMLNVPVSSSAVSGSGGSKAPCLNCRLIQMGSAISYGDNRCPQCGEVCL